MGRQDAGESDFVDGTIEKKGYRMRWLRRVKMIPGHPFKEGIHMDTHHLISAEGVKLSKLGDVLVSKGYDINDIDNLVGFPATLPGACHLKTQLHRGDHTHTRPGEEPYHDHVSTNIQKKKIKIKDCYGKTKRREKAKEIHELLDPIGKKILGRVNSFRLPLTKIFDNFAGSSLVGCANCFDIDPASRLGSVPCAKGRNHLGYDDFRYQGSSARGNKKTIRFSGSWTPRVGM